jgi:hypothetical protein
MNWGSCLLWHRDVAVSVLDEDVSLFGQMAPPTSSLDRWHAVEAGEKERLPDSGCRLEIKSE